MMRIGIAGAGLALGLGLAACVPPPVEVGRQAYLADCAACHGADARGGGPLAGGLERVPPDLTLLAARNGGVFDASAVMSVIDGYFRRDDSLHPMPEFGAAIEGPLVMVETAPGVMTPTPEPLVALAAYLESVQRQP